jgi:hypothetical protein
MNKVGFGSGFGFLKCYGEEWKMGAGVHTMIQDTTGCIWLVCRAKIITWVCM